MLEVRGDGTSRPRLFFDLGFKAHLWYSPQKYSRRRTGTLYLDFGRPLQASTAREGTRQPHNRITRMAGLAQKSLALERQKLFPHASSLTIFRFGEPSDDLQNRCHGTVFGWKRSRML